MTKKIHPSSYISPKAKIGLEVEIGPFSIIHDNVIIGDNTKIGAFSELGVPTPLGDGSPLIIGHSSNIRSHSIFYESSRFGANLVTGHRVTVRENTRTGDSFQIGTSSEIQGDCEIGDHVRFQSNVFVGKKTKIGNFVWVLPNVIFTNDPTPPSDSMIGAIVGDFASISAGALILPGVRVGEYSLVAAAACVTKDVPAYMVVLGVPAKVIGEAKTILRRDGSNQAAYPWVSHFYRDYPERIVKSWQAKHREINKD